MIISMTVTHTKLTHCITINLFIAHILKAEIVFMKYWSMYDLPISSTSVKLYIIYKWLMVVVT
jgi:hypothetical protein